MILFIATAWWELAFAVLGGFVGGALIVTSGGGSFITFPLLLALGDSGIIANATSTVGLWPAGFASLPGLSGEVKSQRRIITYLLIPALAGGIVGSFVLSRTSEDVFSFVAPTLIFLGSISLLYKDKLVHFGEHIQLHTQRRKVMAVGVLIFFVSSYSSFFGAGVGILMLACLSLLGEDSFVHNIAIKNVLVIVANGVAVVYFLFAGLVHWELALALAMGSIPGGFLGGKVLRYISDNAIRRFTVIFGVVASIVLFAIALA